MAHPTVRPLNHRRLRIPQLASLAAGQRGWLVYGLIGGAVGLVSGLIALLERWWAPSVSLAMLHLVGVLAVAASAGRGPAVITAVVAVVTFNFLFVEPRYSLVIQDLNEWLVLVLFLLTAIVTGELAAALRRQAIMAERRAQEMVTLYEVSQALTATIGLSALLTTLVQRVTSLFEIASCTVLMPMATTGTLVNAATAGTLYPPRAGAAAAQRLAQHALTSGLPVFHQSATRSAHPATEPDPWLLALPLTTSGRTLGVLLIQGDGTDPPLEPAAERTLATIAAQAALAIAQAEVTEERTQAEAIRRSDVLKSALLAYVSHDLRTPLASIKTAVTSLLQPSIDWAGEARHEFLTAINEEADRLTRLVTNLLDLSRIEAGALQPQIDWVDLDETITDVVRRLRPVLATSQLRLAIPPDLLLVRVDPVHLEQALGNLIENAARYTPPNQPIEITATQHVDSITIAVIDHGPGIPAADRERLFNAFTRLDRQPGAPYGTGLGLAIVRGLIEANGGRVWLDETPGGGTTAHLSLRSSPPPSPHSPAEPAAGGSDQ